MWIQLHGPVVCGEAGDGNLHSESPRLKMRGVRPILGQHGGGKSCEQAEDVCVKSVFPLIQVSEGLGGNSLGSAWKVFPSRGETLTHAKAEGSAASPPAFIIASPNILRPSTR